MQTVKNSFIESLINTLTGFIFSLIVQLTIFPFYNININFMDNIWITLWFTLASIIRSFIIRRFFNKKDS
jgi:hypothetical protein